MLPFGIVPATYTTLVLCAAAASMYALARRFAPTHIACFAAVLYAANPYMLFTAWERTAFAELLAAAWMPLLLLAAWQERPRAWSLAWPLALLWLTNAPAGVIGTYALVLLALLRLWRERDAVRATLISFSAGLLGGLALAACYLLPAAYERRFVSIDMAVIPGLSVASNTLFAHDGDAAHDFVNAQVSRIAIALLIAAAIALLAALRSPKLALPKRIQRSTLAITLLIAFLLTPWSLFVWRHLPELAFLQFSWRLLALLAPVVALLCAAAVKLPQRWSLPLAAVVACALSFSLAPQYLQGCPIHERPQDVAELYRSAHGTQPTDEYTPLNADNDLLRFDSPGWWLTTDPQAFAPDTLPNPNANAPDVDFGTPPPEQTLSQSAPDHLELTAPTPKTLVLNLRAYPRWLITRNGAPAKTIRRNDGLLAVELPAGRSTIDIRWQTPPTRWLGLGISLLALLLFAVSSRLRSRRITL